MRPLSKSAESARERKGVENHIGQQQASFLPSDKPSVKLLKLFYCKNYTAQAQTIAERRLYGFGSPVGKNCPHFSVTIASPFSLQR
jgi:hypothetical protein